MNRPVFYEKLLVAAILVAGVIGILYAHVSLAVTISTSIPGMGTITSSTPPGAYIGGFYNFALGIGGLLALGAIVYGGVLYATSMGNPSKQSEGRAWIWSALTGLLLLAGAYLILYTINPNLVNLSLPNIQTVNIQAQTQTPTSCTQGTPGCGNSCAPGTVVCGNLCCIGGLELCAHLGGTATRCVINSSCPKHCGSSCCAATQKCIQTQKSPTSPVQSECL